MIVTVNEAGLPLDTDKVDGTVQVAPKGAPEQESDNVPLKPAAGVACSLNCAVCPAVRVAVVDDPEAAVMETAALAVPLTVRDCGEFAALSVIEKVVVRTPMAVGEKTIEIVQEAFAAMEPLQLSAETLKSEELKPVRTELNICSAAPPEFVRVTVCGADGTPCVPAPGKVRVDAGLRVTAGELGGAATAVPESRMNCGLPAALSVMKRVAWLGC